MASAGFSWGSQMKQNGSTAAKSENELLLSTSVNLTSIDEGEFSSSGDMSPKNNKRL